MAIPLIDNFDYSGTKPDFVRQEYRTIAEMKLVADNTMPMLYIAYCLEDQQVYLYNKDNEFDLRTGKFRIFPDIDDVRKEVMPAASSVVFGKIYMYCGETTESFVNGYFYKCLEDSGTYYWAEIVTSDPKAIPLESIDNLF